MRMHACAQERGHKTYYRQWNCTRVERGKTTNYRQWNLVTTILHVISLISDNVFYTDGHRKWR